MIRGISFTAEQQIGDTLHGVLAAIGADEYNWRIIRSQTEAMDSSFENDIFQKEYYNGRELMSCEFHNSLIVFLKIEAYVEKCDFKEIITYTDFEKRDCQVLLMSIRRLLMPNFQMTARLCV